MQTGGAGWVWVRLWEGELWMQRGERDLAQGEPGEAELLARARRGDRAAFDALFDLNLPRVWARVAREIPERAEREAVVERIFQRAALAFEREGALVVEGGFAALLLALTKRELARTSPTRVAGRAWSSAS